MAPQLRETGASGGCRLSKKRISIYFSNDDTTKKERANSLEEDPLMINDLIHMQFLLFDPT